MIVETYIIKIIAGIGTLLYSILFGPLNLFGLIVLFSVVFGVEYIKEKKKKRSDFGIKFGGGMLMMKKNNTEQVDSKQTQEVRPRCLGFTPADNAFTLNNTWREKPWTLMGVAYVVKNGEGNIRVHIQASTSAYSGMDEDVDLREEVDMVASSAFNERSDGKYTVAAIHGVPLANGDNYYSVIFIVCGRTSVIDDLGKTVNAQVHHTENGNELTWCDQEWSEEV